MEDSLKNGCLCGQWDRRDRKKGEKSEDEGGDGPWLWKGLQTQHGLHSNVGPCVVVKGYILFPLPCQSINQLINQSINQSIHPSIHQPIHQPINQSINQSINQLTHPSIYQLINHLIHPSIHLSINQPPINQCINE